MSHKQKQSLKRRSLPEVPKHIAVSQVFSPLYRILSDIRQGEVLEAEGKVIMSINPAFADFRNTLFPAASYLRQWCKVWQVISDMMKEPLSFDALLDVATILSTESEEEE